MSPEPSYCLDGSAELLLNGSYPAGLLTSYIDQEVKKEGNVIDILLKDNLSSNRLSLRFGGATTRCDYGPFGIPACQ